jgi:hypothetical protein
VILTPGVVLSLLDYIQKQIPEFDNITETEQRRIADSQRKLHDFLSVMILDEALFSAVALPIMSRGAPALREALFAIFRFLYPKYKTLISTTQWKSALETYIGVLSNISLLERRGLEPLTAKKSRIARLFGYRSHASFKSQVKLLGPLLDLEDWTGDDGKVRFRYHPVELRLRKVIFNNKKVSKEILFKEARALGYTSEEINYVLEIMERRGQVQKDANSQSYSPTVSLSIEELSRLGHDIFREIELLKVISESEVLDTLEHKVSVVLEQLGQEELDNEDIHVRLVQYQNSLHKFEDSLGSDLHDALISTRDQVYLMLATFEQKVSQSSTGLFIDTHINGIQRTLTRKSEAAHERLTQFVSRVNEALRKPYRVAELSLSELEEVVEQFETLQANATKLLEQLQPTVDYIEIHHNWVSLAERIHRLYDYLSVASQVTEVAHLEAELDNAVKAIAEDFATTGLKGYESAYCKFNPIVDNFSHELETAVELVRNSQGSIGELEEGNTQSNDGLLDCLRHSRSLTLSELFKLSTSSHDSLIRQLIELERSGEVVVQVTLNET